MHIAPIISMVDLSDYLYFFIFAGVPYMSIKASEKRSIIWFRRRERDRCELMRAKYREWMWVKYNVMCYLIH